MAGTQLNVEDIRYLEKMGVIEDVYTVKPGRTLHTGRLTQKFNNDFYRNEEMIRAKHDSPGEEVQAAVVITLVQYLKEIDARELYEYTNLVIWLMERENGVVSR